MTGWLPRRAAFLAIAILVPLVAGFASAQPLPDTGTTIITNVTVLDGRGTAPQSGISVVVHNGTISATGSRLRHSPDATWIDGQGGYLLPGFIDMHAHLLVPRWGVQADGSRFDRPLSERMLSVLVDFGITMVRSPATPTRAGLALRDDLNAGRVRGPRALASAELINDPTLTDPQLRSIVRDALAYRPDYFKVYALLSPAAVASVIDEAHAHGVPVIGHLGRTSWLEAAQLGIDHLTHAVDWSAKTLRPEHRAAYANAVRERGGFRARIDWLELLDLASPEIQETLAEIVRRGISVDPTLVAYDSKFSPPDNERYRRNPFVNVIPELSQDWGIASREMVDWTETDYRRWRAAWPKLLALVKLMHERGVLLTTGTDLTNPWVIPGESLHQEFELLAEAGIPASAILKMTGENAAQALRRDDIGIIEAGRRADLVLLRANPLDDIRNTRRIEWVMMAGQIVSRGPAVTALTTGPK